MFLKNEEDEYQLCSRTQPHFTAHSPQGRFVLCLKLILSGRLKSFSLPSADSQWKILEAWSHAHNTDTVLTLGNMQ